MKEGKINASLALWINQPPFLIFAAFGGGSGKEEPRTELPLGTVRLMKRGTASSKA